MDGKKVYQIEINGIKESANAVESLNKQLSELESRIKALEKNNVKVNTSSSGGSSKSTSAMNEEAKLAKQIETIDAKREAYSKEIYQNYLAAKDVLTETISDQKQLAAAERLQADAYSNTMAGIKQKLADMKSIHFTTDLSSDEFKEQTEEINALTQKLKELEEAYGQFGRNVGNYKSAFDGFEKVTVNINGVTREFNNLMQAQKAVRNEMGILIDKGKENTDQYKKLEQELERLAKSQKKLNSAMNDAKASSQAMDNLLDTMESFTAIGQIGQGFSTLFGFDNSELEQQIAKLVALQNVLQGIEKIRQQMNTGEGIGGWLKKGSDAVDGFVMKLTGAQKRMGMLVKDTRTASIAVQGLSKVLKGLGAVGVAGGIMILMDAFQALVEEFKRWRDGGYKAGAATDVLASQVEVLEKEAEKLKNVNLGNYLKGIGTDEEYAISQTKVYLDLLDKLISRFLDLKDISNYKIAIKVEGGENLEQTEERLKKNFDNISKDIDKIENELKGYDKWAHDWFGKFLYRSGGEDFTKLKKEFQDLGETISENIVFKMTNAWNMAQHELAETGKVSDETAKKIKELAKELEYDPTVNSILTQIDKFSERGQYYIKIIGSMKNSFLGLAQSLQGVDEENIAKNAAKIAQLEVDAMKDGISKQRAQIELNRKQELAAAENDAELKKAINKKYNRQILEAEKTHGREMASAYADLASLRIDIMEEGWKKEKAQLEHERDERIRAIEESEILVGERTEAVKELYRKKIEKGEKEWQRQQIENYREFLSEIEMMNRETYAMEVSNSLANVENRTFENKNKADGGVNKDNYKDINSMKEYYNELLQIELDASKQEEQIRQEALRNELEDAKKDEEIRHQRLVDSENGEYIRQLKEDLITKQQYDDLIQKENAVHNAKMNALDKQYAADTITATQETLDKMYQSYNSYYQRLSALIRRKQDDIQNKLDDAVKKANRQSNRNFGFFNVKELGRQYDEAIKKQKEFIADIQSDLNQLDEDNKAGKVIGEAYEQQRTNLEASLRASVQTLHNYQDEAMKIVDAVVGQINQYFQMLGQSVQQLMSAIWGAQDYQFEKEQKELDDYNDFLDKKLDEQQEIVQKHKDAVNSIEDELSTARGDRRQHLIDQLNAEMAAQRAARKQEQKLQKEKERAEKKQEELDKRRRKEEYDRNVAQAFISWHLGIANGLATQPFLPVGIAMGALATVLGGVQYALVKSQKPYARGGQLDGGVAQGNLHRDGGIPVLGGRASIEGGEYITNRLTTSKNIDLLDYINSKKKKIDITDLMDFYSSGKPRSIFLNSTRKFEDGGVLPTLRDDIEIPSRLIDTMEDYANRPYVVQVVDIMDKTSQVKQVQAMAGIEG